MDLIEAAQHRPDAAAVWDQQESLTFADLAEAADRLAAAIHRRVVDTQGSEAILPIIVGHDVTGVVAIHAAVRAGNSFTAIQSTEDPDAIGDIWQRLGCPRVGVGADGAAADRLRELGVEMLHPRLSPEGTLPPQPVDPLGPGIVVFTSGTSGRPKGAILTWGLVAETYERIQQPAYSGPPECVMDSLYPFTFIGGLRRALTVATGRSLAIAPASSLAPGQLLAQLAWSEVATLGLIPSHARALVEASGGQRLLPTVSNVIIGGEPVEWDLIGGLRRLIATDHEIQHALASSETPTGVLSLTIRPEDPIESGPMPLGFPGTEGRVLLEPITDDADRFEVVVRGSLALGYLDDPELTASRFGVDPDGTRWWRSGDVVERDDRNRLRHAGRVDDLLKVHGRFVDTSHLESLLLSHPAVQRACIVGHNKTPTTRQLVAHVETKPDATISPDELHWLIRLSGAAEGMPVVLMRHEELPRNAQQKIDRGGLAALPVDPWTTPQRRRLLNDTERLVLSTAVAVTGVDRVGADTNLWEVGLDSMGALEMLTALSHACGADLQVSDLVEHPTVAGLARRIARGFEPRATPVVTLNPLGERTPLFAIPGAGGAALGFVHLARHLGPDQPVVVIEAEGLHCHGRPERTVVERARHAVARIQALQPDGSIVVTGYSFGGLVAYEIGQQFADIGRACEVILLDTLNGQTAGQLLAGRPKSETLGERATPARIARSFRFRAGRFLRLLFPGRPRPTRARYGAFDKIDRRAARRYHPRRARFAVTHVVVDGSPATASFGDLTPLASVVSVPGTHRDLLVPPAVLPVAEAVKQRLIDAVEEGRAAGVR